MANKIKIDDILKELERISETKPEILAPFINRKNVTIDQYCTTLTKVDGQYPSLYAELDHVIQGFSDEWTPMGDAEIKAKFLEAFKQKVNLEIRPYTVLGSWLSYLAEEGKSMEEMSISDYIMNIWLAKKLISDIEILSLKGVRDDNDNTGKFGKSLDGIATQVKKGLANTKNPVYSIPLPALTEANILDVIEEYEKNIPTSQEDNVFGIFMSKKIVKMYASAYFKQFGSYPSFTENKQYESPLSKYPLIGLNIPDDIVFSTVTGNLKKLIDVFDVPTITDVQKFNYIIKLFLDMTLGYDFAINELVFVGNFDADSKLGLGDDRLNKIFYPEDYYTIE